MLTRFYRTALSTISLAIPSVAFAAGTWDGGGVFRAPEFDASAAGTVAAIVVGGAFLIARRRRRS